MEASDGIAATLWHRTSQEYHTKTGCQNLCIIKEKEPGTDHGEKSDSS